MAKTAALEVLSDLLHVYANDLISHMLEAFKVEFKHMRSSHRAHLNVKDDTELRAEFSRRAHTFLWFRALDTGAVSEEVFAFEMLELCEYQDNELRLVAMKLLLDSFNLKGTILSLQDRITITADKEETIILEGIQSRKTRLAELEHEPITTSAAKMLPLIEWMNSLLEDTHRGGHSIIAFHQDMMRNEGVLAAINKLLEHHLGVQNDAQQSK